MLCSQTPKLQVVHPESAMSYVWRSGERPYALTPNTVELIPTLGALFPRGGPVQDPVLTHSDDLWYKSRDSKNKICSQSQGW